jgi:deoxyribonuclease-4
MYRIRLGPAGLPLTPTIRGIEEVRRLGLDALEIEFVRGVYMGVEDAKAAGALAKKLDIELSVHAPYWINLASSEEEKVRKSRKFILDSCERAHHLEATAVVFHAGYYQKRTEEECYGVIKKQIAIMLDAMQDEGWSVALAPETTGKPSQFGNLDELLRLREETGTDICVDFAHITARSAGKTGYAEIFGKLRDIEKIHSHFSGIEYTGKGERRHLVMKENEFVPLAEEIMKRKKDITIISESPITWEDSLKMKKVIERVRQYQYRNHGITRD